MPKEEWGTKRVCPTTGKRFYDLNRSPIVSPYTGDVVTPETTGKSRALISEKSAPKPAAKDKVEPEEADAEVLEEDDAADVDLGDDVLEDDSDDDNVSLDDLADVPADEDDS